MLSGTNQLASITTPIANAPTATRAIAYDARGNPTSETRSNGASSQSVAIAYDGHGRMTGYSRSGEVSLTHAYNGNDDRISTTTISAATATPDTRRFVYASDGRVIGEYGTSASDVRAEFIWLSPQVGDGGSFGGDDGLGGYMPLAVAANDNGAGPQLIWVHANHMSVPAVYTDASGAAINAPSGYSAPGFPGQSRTLGDLYYNRYRDYDPSTGRYIQADPIGLAGGASPYSYAMNSPLRYSDPLGLEFVNLIPNSQPNLQDYGDEAYRKLPKNIRDNNLVVMIHGNPDEVCLPGGICLDGPEFANWLKKKKYLIKGRSIVLWSCNTGRKPNGFAQELADDTELLVYAPTKLMWWNKNGQGGIYDRGPRGTKKFWDPGWMEPFNPR